MRLGSLISIILAMLPLAEVFAEVCCVCHGGLVLCVQGEAPASGLPPCERPVVLALTAGGQLLAYQAFDSGPCTPTTMATDTNVNPAGSSTDGASVGMCASLAFSRLDIEWASHEAPATVPGVQASATAPLPRLTRFAGVASINQATQEPGPKQCGVFICGARPVWLVAARGTLWRHPMLVDGPISAMTPFHNINCAHGFIVAAASGAIKICHLPSKTRLDCAWAARKVRQAGSGTISRLAHIREASLLAVASSRRVPTRPRLPEEAGGDAHACAAYAAAAAAAAAAGKEDVAEVRLLTLPGLKAAPGAKPMVQGPGEVIQAVRHVYLRDATTDNLLPFLVVGTASPLGEDYPCLGKLALYTVERGVRSLGNGEMETVWSVKEVLSREVAGAVSLIQDFKGMLLAGVGKLLELYVLRITAAVQPGSTQQYALIKAAFHEMHVLPTSVAQVRVAFLFLRFHGYGL